MNIFLNGSAGRTPKLDTMPTRASPREPSQRLAEKRSLNRQKRQVAILARRSTDGR